MSPKDIESLLRERLGPSSGRPLPSPGFEGRVRRSLTAQVRSRRRAHAVEALAGIAAVVALAAVVVPWWVGPRSGVGGPGAGASPSVLPTFGPTVVVSPSPTAIPLAHAQKWFLAFDYPAAWTLSDQNVLSLSDPNPGLRFTSNGGNLEVFGRSVGFLGSGSAKDVCQGDQVSLECTTQWTLPEGSVEVRFWVSSAGRWNGLSAIDGHPLDGYTSTTIDGLPAMFAKTTGSISNAALMRPAQVVPDADEVLSWVLPTQRELAGVYTIEAAIRGPNAAELEAQVRAMVASLRWEPAAYRLPTDAAALEAARKAAARPALSFLRTSVYQYGGSHFYDCFPTEVGASTTATITASVQAPLMQPLPVTCTTDVAPNVMQGWTLSLTQTWAAGPDYPAGQSTVTVDLNLDGTVAEVDQTTRGWMSPDYPHQGSSGPG